MSTFIIVVWHKGNSVTAAIGEKVSDEPTKAEIAACLEEALGSWLRDSFLEKAESAEADSRRILEAFADEEDTPFLIDPYFSDFSSYRFSELNEKIREIAARENIKLWEGAPI